jgi:hopanoid-associated sugar epimerase
VTTLVTGASGHIGNNLVRALLERGERVRVLLREGSNNRAVDGLPVERAFGDLRDRRSLEAAVDGCERLYHLAAYLSIRNGDRDQIFDINILGTRRLLQAAQKAGVRRVVYCSSFGAMGVNPGGLSDEEWIPSPFEPMLDYERSKYYAEHEVLRAAVRGLDVTIVNPSGVIGANDFKPSLVGKTFIAVAEGKMIAYVPGAWDFTPMRDVVAGHLLAMEHGKTGERYLLSGDVVTIDQMLDWLVELTGAPRPRLKVPPALMQSVALVKDWVEKTFFPQVSPRFNYHSIRLLKSRKRADNRKSQRELGWRPTPVKDAVRESIEWFYERDYIRTARAAPDPAAIALSKSPSAQTGK